MKQFFDFLFMFILMVGVVFLVIRFAWFIAESDLPFWVKFWLLSK